MIIIRHHRLSWYCIIISFEFPGILLNLIKLNAPATAKDVPKFPFINNITTCTSTGNIASVNKKFGVVFVVILCVKLITPPKIIATIIQIIQFTKQTQANLL